MRRNIQLFTVIALSTLIVFSCSSTKQVACPDNSDNGKLNHKTAQAYKSKKYKTPKVKQRQKVKSIRIKPARTTVPAKENMSTRALVVEPQPLTSLAMTNVLAPIKTPNIVYQPDESNSELDVKISSTNIYPQGLDLQDATEVYKLTAANNEPTTSSKKQIVSEIGDASQVDVSIPVVSNSNNLKSNKATKRKNRKELRSYFKNQPDGGDKPVMGFAIASLVCGIVGLFFAGIVLGTLAIVFGGIAVSRAKSNESKDGRGLAIAGLVIGIVSTVGALLVVAFLL